MLFSGKENVFMCLVAFQKIFQKIFSGVWKRRRKKQTQKNTNKTQKKKSSTIAVVGLELAKHRAVEPSRASIWVLSVFFWVCLFLLLFQTPENIFRKIFENATKHMKTFSFPENSISEKWNIFRKYFYMNQTQPKAHQIFFLW